MIPMFAKIIVIIIVGFLVGMALYYFILWAFGIEEWRDHSKTADIRLDFDHFLQLYNVAPQKYKTEKNSTKYFYTFHSSRNRIGFSYLDYRKYKKWLKQKDLTDKQLTAMKKKKSYLESAQRDIDAYKEQCRAEIEEMQQSIYPQTRA